MAAKSDGSQDACVEDASFSQVTKIPAGAFYIRCSCKEKFLDFDTYDTHRAKARAGCRSSPVLAQRPKASNNPFSRINITSEKQLGAFFGDLEHKREVTSKYQKVGNEVQSFFENRHQAWYVRKFFPELIVQVPNSQQPSDKTVGTIFEYFFHTSIGFRFAYLRWLPNSLTVAPFGDYEQVPDREILDFGVSTETNVEPVVRGVLGGRIESEDLMQGFEFPLDQRDPGIWIPSSQDAQVQLDWALEARFHFGYPDICGYVRGGNGFTSGDSSPWFLSARTRLDGTGCVGIKFPPRKSIFDNDPPGSRNNRWPVDGLWHPSNETSFLGFKVHLWVIGRQANFCDPFFAGSYYSTVVPRSRAGLELFVDFLGEPGQQNYFILRREVLWTADRWDPPPEPPGNEPDPHLEL